MFERTKIDNSQHQAGVPVEITRDDASIDKGKLLIPVSASIIDILNGAQQFLEFEAYTGERMLLAKSTIKALRVITPPGAGNLQARLRDNEFDPYRILGVAPDASWDDVRHAYLARAKEYHPDRYAQAELPKEVRDYLAAMARRVNVAYAALEKPQNVRRENARNRTEPVYSSRPR